MTPPPVGYEEEPPPPEPYEMRGSMEGHPRYATHPPGSLANRILDALSEKGDEIIQVFSHRAGGAQWTASALAHRAGLLARGLAGVAGVVAGDVVCFVGGAHAEYAPLMLASFMTGATFAPLNHLFDDGDLRRMLDLLTPRVVLALAEVSQRLRILAASGDGPAPLVVTLGEGDLWNALLTHVRDHVWSPYNKTEKRELPQSQNQALTATALIACSSGSTGLPKGVVYSNGTMHAVLDLFNHPDLELGTDGKILITSPAFWATGIWYNILSMIKKNCCVINEYGATERQVLDAIEEHQPRALFTSNNFLLSLAKTHEGASPGARRNVSSLRMVLCSGAAMSREADAFVQRVFLHTRLLSLYGMTEINCGIGITKVDVRKTGSVGELCPFLRCKVVDLQSERALGPNQRGELRFKSPTIMCRYLLSDETNEQVCDENGWLRSGDVGHYDENGMFYITGRIKDNIKYRGVHVSPIELEGILDSHPAVLESAVVGVPDPTEQELPRAYVVLRPGASVSAEKLKALVQSKVAEHKWLRGGVVFLNEIPKSATGKISRAEIRRRYLGED